MKHRKLLSILLALALALSLCVPALAADGDVLTRGKFVMELYKLTEAWDGEAKQDRFDDVPAEGELALAVDWAAALGIVNGYGGRRFGPDDPVTREQMAAMLYRNAKLYGQGFQGMWYFPLDYPDAAEVSDWADEAMHWVVMHEILIGTENGLEPKATATEDQLALVLDRWQVALGTDVPADDTQNPAMNFIGPYVSDRAHALVEAEGKENAKITIEWGSSAWETAKWVMSGRLDPDTLTVAYTDCVRSTLVYGDDGALTEETVEYKDGTGTIVFGEDLTFTWKGDQDEQEDLVFAWSWDVPADSIDYLALVNKCNPLPEGWEDALETVTVTNSVGDEVEVEAKAYDAYLALKADLEENDGIYLELDSARRSVAEQQDIMERFTEKYGADYAAKTVAQPGYSEHHTGLALDLYFKTKNDDGSFADVYYNEDMEKEEYKGVWEAIHAKLPQYGFILRYLEGAEHITGYRYEPWHIRYLDDADIAAAITDAGATLEEYLAGKTAPAVDIDLSGSALYTEAELYDAMLAVKCTFAAFDGCELHSIRYAGDACNSAENVQWMNELDEGKGYTQVCELLSDLHSPVEQVGAWEPDTEYTDWQWWLARTEGGGWELLTWGY